MSFKRYYNPLSLEKTVLCVNNQLVAMNRLIAVSLHSLQTSVPIPKNVMYFPCQSPRWTGRPCDTLYNLTVVGEGRSGPAKRPEDIVTLKTFFNNGTKQSFSDKKKEEIYWKVFIGSGGEESALVTMRLKASVGALGYDGWTLPNGDIVRLADMRLVSFIMECGRTTVFQKFYPDGRSFSTCIEFDQPLDDEELSSDADPRVSHSVLGFILPKTGKYFVVDPFSLKFGIRREGYLFWWGDWDQYIQALPGNVDEISRPSWGPMKANDKDVKMRLALYGAGMQVKYGGPNFMQVAEVALLPSLDKPSCTFCGTLGDEALKNCSSCKMAQYCDKWCQKSGWKVHREECGKK